MKNYKKQCACLLFASILAIGCSTTVNAVTPLYTPPKMPEIPEIHVELPDEMKDAINKAVEESIKKMTLDQPVISSSSYFKRTVKKHEYAYLTVKWDKVKNATSYDIKITKADGTSKTYNKEHNIMVLNTYKDDFIMSGMDNAKVRIKAHGKDGAYSPWSESKEINCY